jgi:hypothetical protein
VCKPELSFCEAQQNGMKKISSTDFLLISECVNQTVQGMWGNAARPEPVREIKQIDGGLSVGFGPRKETAAAVLRADALQGTLPVFVRARPTADAEGRSRAEPQRVPPELLKRLLPVRGGLPDHPMHVRRRASADGQSNDDLVVLLRHGQLVVRRADFVDWYKHRRRKGYWPSQASRLAPRRGRPTKDTGSLRRAILSVVHDDAWRAADGMPTLRRLLLERGYEPPSCDTLGRVVDKLYCLMGETALRRSVRRPPRSKSGRFPQ